MPLQLQLAARPPAAKLAARQNATTRVGTRVLVETAGKPRHRRSFTLPIASPGRNSQKILRPVGGAGVKHRL